MRAAGARVALWIASAAVLASGCTYHNTTYNAGRIFDRAEASRRAGQDSAASELYREVVRKTGAAYRARPEADWAPEALLLFGRAQLRLGDLGAAEGALVEAGRRASPRLREEVRVHHAAVLAARGDQATALTAIHEALETGVRGSALAHAHLLRGEWLLARGYVDPGWWDLDRAVEALPEVRVEAGLLRMRWAVRHGDTIRARTAADLLLSYPEAGARLDGVVEALEEASQRWGVARSAGLLERAAGARWDREARGRIRLERARRLHQAGDTAAAAAEAWGGARPLGDAAADARVLIARWQLQDTDDLADAYAVRSILLPAGPHPEVAELVEAVDELERFTDIGLSEPLGWFAAAEVARDRLRAEYLARGLFLAYADGAPDDPWAPKALLAALEVSPSEGDRAWLRGRLEAHAESPYVLAAFGGTGAGFEALEEELTVRLRGLTER